MSRSNGETHIEVTERMDIVLHIAHHTLAAWDALGAVGASFDNHGFYIASNLRSWRIW